MTTFVALLRAVNVSGQNRVPMAELRTALEAAGMRDVATYLQSGNVVFRAPDAKAGAGAGAEAAGGAPELARVVHDVIARSFGFTVGVIVLTAEEVAAAAADNPFLARPAGADEKTLHVTFLERLVDESAFGGLLLPAAPGEEAALAPGGRMVYLRLPHGYGRSKLTNTWFERHLGVATTTRNWRTVGALVEMSAGA